MPDHPTPQPDPCPTCGAEVPPAAPGGICTTCLVTSILDPHPPPAGQAPPTSPAADRIPGFQLLDRLGEGGFGVVYAARQLHPVQRKVAVKILKHGFDLPDALARFEAERQALALMDHPGIAHVYDAGTTTDGQPYFVMELIEGTPVNTHCTSSNLTRTQRLDLFTQVCAAVAHAHRRGVIHRDLKPSNVLVPSPPAPPTPKIIDFGIAKATESLLTDRTLLTRGGQALGTPSHMSPEQAAGTGIVDTRSDIYSLGVILYELVTGTPPFRQQDLGDLPHDEALKKIRTGTPPRPSARIRESNPTAPRDPLLRDLDWIVLRALEKEPDRRYPTADGLAADIARCIAGDAVEARPPSTAYRLSKFVRKNRIPVLATLAVAAALVVATAVSLTMFLRAEQSDTRGRQQFSHADFTHATSLVAGRPAVAVAHLTRALRTNPDNPAATSLLLHTLASQDWPARAMPTFDHRSLVRAVDFSADGTRLFVTGDRDHLDIIDIASGHSIASLPLGGQGSSLALSPDGQHLAVFMSMDGFALIQLGDHSTTARLTGIPGLGGNTAWLPDGSLLAVAIDSQPVRIWDMATEKFTAEIPTSGSQVRASFSPTTGRLAVASADTLQFFDPSSANPIHPVFRHTAEIDSFHITPDGTRIVIHGHDNIITVRDSSTSATLHHIDHGSHVESLAVSPDGALLVTGTSAGFAQVWNLKTGTPLGEPIPHDGSVSRIVFSPDGTLVATGSWIDQLGAAAVKIWDARTRQPVSAPIYHPRGAGTLAFHPAGTHIAVGSRSRLAAVWKLQRNSMLPRVVPHPDPVWRIAFDPATRHVLTLTTGGVARAWDPRDGAPAPGAPQTVGPSAVAAHAGGLQHGFSHLRPASWPRSPLSSIASCLAPRFHAGGVFAAAASPDGSVLATGANDSKLRLWSLLDGTLLHTLEAGGSPVYSVAIDPTGTRVATGGARGNVIVFDIQSGNRIASLLPHKSPVISLAFSPDGDFLASGSPDQTARLTDLRTTPPSTARPLPHQGQVSQLAFSPDADTLATSGDANATHLWFTSSSTGLVPPLLHIDIAPPHGSFPLWLPGGDRLVTTGSHDNSAHLWDTRSGRRLAKPMLLPSGTRAAALRPDGGALFTAGDLREARLWDLGSGEPLTPLLLHDERVSACAFDPAGQHIATATLAGTLYVRDLPPPHITLTESQLSFAEALAGFRFNPDGVLEQSPTTPAGLPAPSGPWFAWLADRTTTSPHSTLDIDTYITALRQRDTHSSLREALLRRPSDSAITSAFAARLLEDRNPDSHDHSLGRFLAQHDLPKPQRPPGLPPHLIDLSPSFNASLDRDPLHPGTGNSLARLEPGTHHLTGTDFDIRALVVLGSQRVDGYPHSTTLQLGQHCSHLHFLHGALHAVDPPGTTIGTYTVNRADGTSTTTDLVIGHNIRDWWHQPGDQVPPDLPGATLAWQGTNAYIGARDIKLSLHHLTVENSAPEIPVTSVTFASSSAQGAPFLVALTITPAPLP